MFAFALTVQPFINTHAFSTTKDNFAIPLKPGLIWVMVSPISHESMVL